MSPEEAKGWVDIVVAALGAGGLGSIVLALAGAKKAKHEETEAAEKTAPTIGHAGMSAIGGALLAESAVDGLTKGVAALALSQTSSAEQRRTESREQIRVAEAMVSLGHDLLDELRELRRAIRHVRPDD